VSRAPRDRAAGYVVYPDDSFNDPLYRALGALGRGIFDALEKALWKTPEIGVVQGDDELLASLGLCSAEEWITARARVARMFDTTSRPGFWIHTKHVEHHRALQTAYQRGQEQRKAAAKASVEARRQSSNTKPPRGDGTGRSTKRARRVNGAVDEPLHEPFNEPSTDRSTARQQNGEQSLLASLEDSSNGEPSASLRSASGEVAFASPLRCEAKAPEPAAALRAAGETVHAARDEQPRRGVVLELPRQGVEDGVEEFPQGELWLWLSRELVTVRPRPLMALSAWLWGRNGLAEEAAANGIGALETLQAFCRHATDNDVREPYAYYRLGAPARNALLGFLRDQALEAETARRDADERRLLGVEAR